MNKLRWYTYDQSKVGGYFVGPARTIIVAATSPVAADVAAEKVGAEFMSDALSCCGRRWSRMAEHVWEVADVPSYGGRPVTVTPDAALTIPSDTEQLSDAHRGLAILVAADGTVSYGPMKAA
ncbi:MAG: hypothetical protein FWD83_10935 [Promicromonosporaceae bacterium]|nr:hypothetical protein [Promicromonosporaceae bacterium]